MLDDKFINSNHYKSELKKIHNTYAKAERDIIDMINFKKKNGMISYNEHTFLTEVDLILNGMLEKEYKLIPNFFEKQFIISKYGNAVNKKLSYDEKKIIDRLTNDFMGKLYAGSETIKKRLSSMWKQAISDSQSSSLFTPSNSSSKMLTYINKVTSPMATSEVIGVQKALVLFTEGLAKEGITSYVDKGGKKWTLSNYSDMLLRTNIRQTTNLGVLYSDTHDLYKISSHGSTCPICKPLEGRIYSMSGKNKNYPPLSRVYKKIDKGGPDDLANTYLSIHPNCLHVLVKYTEAGKSEKEIKKMKDYSDFTKNPNNENTKSHKELERYYKKEKARAKLMREYKVYQEYRTKIGNSVPKTFGTFEKHKGLNDAQYKNWNKKFKAYNALVKEIE